MASFTTGADHQGSSPFFTKLPFEVRRLIYVEVCRASGLKHHITTSFLRQKGQFRRVRCICDPSTVDDRYTRFRASTNSEEAQKWTKRLQSDWNVHWACEEAWEEAPEKMPQPYWPVLLACKRIYLECLPTIFASTTFVFTNISIAAEFLSLFAPPTFHSLELSFRVESAFTELYYPTEHGPPQLWFNHPDGRSVFMTMADNPWRRLCATLALMPALRTLRVWLDSLDVRPWHKRVAETSFLAGLREVRTTDHSGFVLALPELPESERLRGLPGMYLEGKELEGAPFRIERAWRQNNLKVHLLAWNRQVNQTATHIAEEGTDQHQERN